MERAFSDRLTALDKSFLDLESENVHMHVGTVAIFESGPLAREDGGLDFERILEFAQAGLQNAPRFRQKLATVPLTGDLAWVDDERFDLLHHIRHVSLPRPGDDRLLKRVAGRVMSQKLDRAKPMWELWFVEGLEAGHFAVISKVHHCLVDGVAGVDLLASFMGTDPEYHAESSAGNWVPRPRPGPFGLLRKEVLRRGSIPGRVLREGGRWLRHPQESAERMMDLASGVVESLSKTLTAASATPFNVPIGPHRRFDWARFDMTEMREVERKFGATLNDVALACVAGAMRTQLSKRDVPMDEIDEIDFRVLVPVSTRKEKERGELGNRVSLLVASLPVGERDPRRRIDRIIDETRKLKQSNQVAGAAMIEELSDWTTAALITEPSRLAASRPVFNMVVTNVPGPPVPIYLAGSRMLSCYPLVPLFENQGIGVALFSYEDELHWGFNADWDVVTDLHDFVMAVMEEFEVMRKM